MRPKIKHTAESMAEALLRDTERIRTGTYRTLDRRGTRIGKKHDLDVLIG